MWPRQTTFHHPASGQQNKPALGFRQLDDVQGNSFGLRGCGSSFAGITPIDKSQSDRVACGVLDIGGKAGNCCAIADVGGRHVQCKQVAERIDSQMHLRPAFALGAIIAEDSSVLTTRS